MQDVYRRLSAPQALGGLLRVRTSPDFRTGRAFGHLYPDDQYDNLFHVISCDPQDAFAFDFEFAKCAFVLPSALVPTSSFSRHVLMILP